MDSLEDLRYIEIMNERAISSEVALFVCPEVKTENKYMWAFVHGANCWCQSWELDFEKDNRDLQTL